MHSDDILKLSRMVTAGGHGISDFVPISTARTARNAQDALKYLSDMDTRRDAYGGGWYTCDYLTRTHTARTMEQAQELEMKRSDRLDKGYAEAVPIIETNVVDEKEFALKVKAANAQKAREAAIDKARKKLSTRKNVEDTLEIKGRVNKLRDGGALRYEETEWGTAGWVVKVLQGNPRAGYIDGGHFLVNGKIMNKREAKRAIQAHYQGGNYWHDAKLRYLIINVYPGAVLDPIEADSSHPTWEVTVKVTRKKVGTKVVGHYLFGIAAS